MSNVETSTFGLDGQGVGRPGGFGPAGDVVTFLDLARCGIALATVSAEGRPVVGKGIGCVVDGDRLRLTLRRSANEALIEAVLLGAPVAATFSQPTTHGSIQFKARTGQLDDPDRADYLAAERQREAFSAELMASAYDTEFTERYTAFAPHELVVVEIVAGESFDQTPGPAAGARLR